MTALALVFALCAFAAGLLSLIRTRWSQVLSLFIGLLAIAYGCYYEFGIAAEGIEFSLFNAQISYIWTGISRVLWPTVLIPTIIIYLTLFDLKDRNWIESFVSLSLVTSLGVFLVLTSRTFLSMFLAWQLMEWSSFLLVKMSAQNKNVVKFNLIWNILSTIAMIIAVVLLSGGSLDSSFATVSDKLLKYNVFSLLGLLVFFLIFLSNMGIFPFHKRAEQTFTGIDPVISAYLSGSVTKAGLFGAIFLSLLTGSEWMAHFGTLFSRPLVSCIIGAFVIAWAIISARKAANGADSSHSLVYISSLQLSYVVLILPFMPMQVDYLPSAFIASVMLGYAHSIAQTSLYMASAIAHTRSTSLDSIDEVQEGVPLWKGMPIIAAQSLVSGLSIAALPPLIGFGAVYMVYTGLLETGEFILAGLLLFISLSLFVCIAHYWSDFFYKSIARNSRVLMSNAVGIFTCIALVGMGVFNTSFQKLLAAPLKDLKGFLVFDFSTETASGGWNSLYVLAVLLAAILLSALIWSFSTSEQDANTGNTENLAGESDHLDELGEDIPSKEDGDKQ